MVKVSPSPAAGGAGAVANSCIVSETIAGEVVDVNVSVKEPTVPHRSETLSTARAELGTVARDEPRFSGQAGARAASTYAPLGARARVSALRGQDRRA